MKLESWLKHHSASKSKFNLEILHTLKDLHIAGLFFIIKLTTNFGGIVTPIFKCLICRKDIERSTKTFWIKKGHLLCSSCLDTIEKKSTK